MPKHSRPRSLKKLPASLVLSFTALSMLSPVAALFVFPEKADGGSLAGAMLLSPTSPPTSPPTTAPAVSSTTTVLAKAKEKVLPTITRPQITTQTTKSVPVSKPAPTTSTRPKPTVAQRQVQRATSSPPAPKKVTPSTTVTPKPTTVRRTTNPAPPAPPPQPIRKTTSQSPSPSPKPTPTTTKEAPPPPPKAQTPSHQLLVSLAQKYVGRGIPYRMGGNSLTTGMDCSHFIWMVLKEAGYNVPYRDSTGLASWTTRVTDPQPGDLVLYRGHASVYAGGGMMIDQGRADGAHFQKVYTQNFIGYGRIPL